MVARTVSGGIAGGIISEIYGGNFWQGFGQGAATAAAAFLFNETLEKYNSKKESPVIKTPPADKVNSPSPSDRYWECLTVAYAANFDVMVVSAPILYLGCVYVPPYWNLVTCPVAGGIIALGVVHECVNYANTGKVPTFYPKAFQR